MSKEKKSKEPLKLHKNWLMQTLFDPEWIPEYLTTVTHNESGKAALVITSPKHPEEIFGIKEGQTVKPMICNILLCEQIIEDIDISELSPL